MEVMKTEKNLPMFESGSDWITHCQNLEDYFDSQDIDDDKTKTLVLLKTVEPNVSQIMQGLCFPLSPFFKTYDELCKIMEQHYSVFKERRKFSRLQQLSDESVTRWHKRVSGCAVKCDFGNQLEVRIKDQFVAGLDEGKISDKVLNMSFKTPIAKILEIALKEEEKVNEIKKLPDDCLLHIFKFLPAADRFTAAKVCESWNDIVKLSWSNMKELKMSNKFLGSKPIHGSFKYPEINNYLLEAILKKCGKYLKKINVELIKNRCPLSLIAEYCPNIKSIKCNKISVTGLEKLSASCKNISEISIQSAMSHEFDEVLGSLFSSNKKLQIIDIPKFTGIGNCLSKLHFKEITTLKIGKLHNEESFNLLQAIQSSQNLSTFEYVFRKKIIAGLIESCTNLNVLNLKCNNDLEADNADNMLSQIFLKNRNLKSIKLESFKNLTGRCFDSLNKNVIEEIMLSKADSLQRAYLIRSWPNFKKLHTLEIKNFSKNSFDLAVECISLCSTLKKLIIFDVDILENFVLFDSSKNVETLVINMERNRVSSTFTSNLVDISHNPTKSFDTFLRYVSRNLLDLKYLDLRGCKGITDIALRSIRNLPKLEVLKIKDVAYLTGSEFFLASTLKILECRGCPNLHDDNLIKLLRRAKNLELLDIEGCSDISNATINAAIKILKNRTNNIVLEIRMGNTNINLFKIKEKVPLLHLINSLADKVEQRSRVHLQVPYPPLHRAELEPQINFLRNPVVIRSRNLLTQQ